jgi:hypothetical protein
MNGNIGMQTLSFKNTSLLRRCLITCVALLAASLIPLVSAIKAHADQFETICPGANCLLDFNVLALYGWPEPDDGGFVLTLPIIEGYINNYSGTDIYNVG